MVKIEDQEGKPVWDKPVAVDEKWIESVDDNVSASEPLDKDELMIEVAETSRVATRLQDQRHRLFRVQLLDTYSQDLNRAS